MTYTTSRPVKDTALAYILLAASLLGFAGLQHFYLGRPVRGIVWLLTWGLLGVGSLYDLFTLRGQVDTVNWRRLGGARS